MKLVQVKMFMKLATFFATFLVLQECVQAADLKIEIDEFVKEQSTIIDSLISLHVTNFKDALNTNADNLVEVIRNGLKDISLYLSIKEGANQDSSTAESHEEGGLNEHEISSEGNPDSTTDVPREDDASMEQEIEENQDTGTNEDIDDKFDSVIVNTTNKYNSSINETVINLNTIINRFTEKESNCTNTQVSVILNLSRNIFDNSIKCATNEIKSIIDQLKTIVTKFNDIKNLYERRNIAFNKCKTLVPICRAAATVQFAKEWLTDRSNLIAQIAKLTFTVATVKEKVALCVVITGVNDIIKSAVNAVKAC